MNTRRYPRTLEQAFGPYTSRHVHVDAPRASLRAWAAYLLIVALAIAAAMLAGCTRVEATPTIGPDRLLKTEPDEHGVVCYQWDHGNAHISCVKVK
jgi:hypothetical protein